MVKKLNRISVILGLAAVACLWAGIAGLLDANGTLSEQDQHFTQDVAAIVLGYCLLVAATLLLAQAKGLPMHYWTLSLLPFAGAFLLAFFQDRSRRARKRSHKLLRKELETMTASQVCVNEGKKGSPKSKEGENQYGLP